MSVQVSGDGAASWTELTRLAGPADDSAPIPFVYDIGSYTSADTRVRFVVADRLSGRVGVDSIELSGGDGAQGSDPNADQTPPGYSSYPAVVGADTLHGQGITGAGVTIAVVDTGFWPWTSLAEDTQGSPRLLVRYDAIRKELHLGDDLNGHGTHVSSIMLNSSSVAQGGYNGIAPDAGIVGIKAFDNDGRASYANVIHAPRLDPGEQGRLRDPSRESLLQRYAALVLLGRSSEPGGDGSLGRGSGGRGRGRQ